jgi:uncharacterized OsmC-like protein
MTDRAERTSDNRTRAQDEPVDRRIGRALARLESAVEQRPGFGRSTNRSVTTLVDGLRCSSREGEHRIISDLPAALGGDGTAPTPSVLLRAALGSCLAMGYRLRSARNGLPVDSIRVEVETDSAVAGMLDPDSAFRPGFVEIRYHVAIASAAPVADIERVIDEGDRLSPVLDAIAGVNRLERSLSPVVSGPSGDGGR